MRAIWSLLILFLILASCTSTPPVLPSATTILGETAISSLTGRIENTRPPTITPTETTSPVPTETLVPTVTPPPPCDVNGWLTDVEPLLTEYFDIADVANVTPRSALSSVLLEMRQSYRAFERFGHPDCVTPIFAEILAGLDFTYEGYSDFLAEYEASSAADFQIAAAHFWAAAQAALPYGARIESRALAVNAGVSAVQINAPTATWVAEQGVYGLVNSAYTATWAYFDAENTRMAPTLEAILSR